ncbi:MAG: putative alpha/beta-fold hydrolase [Akkermansiaceae bacterium]|jgi:predicted alpha/beta-fold hydrolase
MPLTPSSYRAPLGLRGGHFATIYPTLFRRVSSPAIERERLELSDGDFLDLDWSQRKHQRLAIIGHGLEGESSAKYIRGMSLALQKRGWDTLAWNCRGCSGEPNRLLRSYHSGVSDDLSSVVDHALSEGYQELALVGFSLGGNIVLKYLGEQGSQVHPEIKAAVSFSAPCDLTSSSLRLGDWDNRIYMSRFMDGLKDKVIQKNEVFPGKLDLTGLKKVKTFAEFDNRFTAPLNGFTDARDYWTRASSKPHLRALTVPTLMVQALNDPFLPEPCFPREVADQSRSLYLETPPHGGHVGFISRASEYWSETRCAEFLTSR